MIIYKTTNTINGKIYVGQDKNNNPNYYGSGKLLQKAIRKYGKEKFKKEVLEVCESESHLNNREVFWIREMNSTDRSVGYNISDGSKEGDRKIGHDIAKGGIYNYWVKKYGVEEAERRNQIKIEKIRKRNRDNGTILTKKGRYDIWLEKYGEEEADRRYDKWRIKISQYQQYKIESGWKHSDDAKKKISESSKGRACSDETKQKLRKPKPTGFSDKISKIKKGVKLGPSKKRKPILQFDMDNIFIKEWESVSSAESELKIYNINAVCKGKQQTAGGYKWKYKTI